jgi:hypothetical protein
VFGRCGLSMSFWSSSMLQSLPRLSILFVGKAGEGLPLPVGAFFLRGRDKRLGM